MDELLDGFIGTALHASIKILATLLPNAKKQVIYEHRDDFEALFHTLLYLLKPAKLSWAPSMMTRNFETQLYYQKVNGVLLDKSWEAYTPDLGENISGESDRSNWISQLLPILNKCRDRLFPINIKLKSKLETGIHDVTWTPCLELFTEEEEKEILKLC